MSEWIKTAEALPNKNLLVEVKSDYFPDGENYAVLANTEYGMNWLYFGSDPIHNEAKTIPFEYVSEWRWVEKERWFEDEKWNKKRMLSEFEEVRKIIKEYYNEADGGLFFCRNTAGDRMDTIYDKHGIQIDICYDYGYFEVFGLDLSQQLELTKFYNTLKHEDLK